VSTGSEVVVYTALSRRGDEILDALERLLEQLDMPITRDPAPRINAGERAYMSTNPLAFPGERVPPTLSSKLSGIDLHWKQHVLQLPPRIARTR
jgi:hypothetical protein